MIDENAVKQSLKNVRIEEVIVELVPTQKKGKDFVWLCPLHAEKYKSIQVFHSKGIFKCFACGEEGNVISLLMKYKKYTYIESLQWLAKKYGI